MTHSHQAHATQKSCVEREFQNIAEHKTGEIHNWVDETTFHEQDECPVRVGLGCGKHEGLEKRSGSWTKERKSGHQMLTRRHKADNILLEYIPHLSAAVSCLKCRSHPPYRRTLLVVDNNVPETRASCMEQ